MLYVLCVFRELYLEVLSGCGKVRMDGPAAVGGNPWRYARGPENHNDS